MIGLPGPPLPARQLTLPPLHQDSAVGPGGAVTLHRVTVGAVVILIPEGAVLHHLLRCRNKQSAGHRPQPGAPPGLARGLLLTAALLWGPPHPSQGRGRRERPLPGEECEFPADCACGGGEVGAPLRRIVKSLQICACPGHHSGAGLLEHVSDPEERRLSAPRARLCAFPMFMALSPGLSALARLGMPSLGLCALSGTPLCGQPVLSLDYKPPPTSTAPPR